MTRRVSRKLLRILDYMISLDLDGFGGKFISTLKSCYTENSGQFTMKVLGSGEFISVAFDAKVASAVVTTAMRVRCGKFIST